VRRVGAAVAVAVVLGGCGSGGTKTVTVTSTPASASTSSTAATSAASTTSTTNTTSSSSSVATVHLATFKSPSGNIGCAIIAGTARCDIDHRTWSPPPKPKSCPDIVDFGQGLIVGNTGAGRLVCAGDTERNPQAPVLAYNTDTIVGSFRCASRGDGMTCTNTASGHGFFIAIQSYRAF
jgi:hypothetical protein